MSKNVGLIILVTPQEVKPFIKATDANFTYTRLMETVCILLLFSTKARVEDINATTIDIGG